MTPQTRLNAAAMRAETKGRIRAALVQAATVLAVAVVTAELAHIALQAALALPDLAAQAVERGMM